jgi:DNA-binding GntR family transcriptional regulator
MDSTKPTDLKTWAYNSIKELIVSGQFGSGQQLKIEELEGILNISRTPIREALLSLLHEGLVEVKSRVGFFVRSVTKKEFDDLFEVRELLEVFAVKKTVALISSDEVNRLGLIDKESAAIGKLLKDDNFSPDDAARFLACEIEIHSIIIKNAENDILTDFLERIRDLVSREKAVSVKSPENVSMSIKEHHDIIEAIRKKDAALAEKMMRIHINNIKARIESLFNFEGRPS